MTNRIHPPEEDASRLSDGLRATAVDRRRFLSLVGGAAASLGLVACGGSSDSSPDSSAGQDQGPLPSSVPPGTQLTIANPATALQLKLSGLDASLTFKVPEWPNV